jgi:hypothetical protein
MKNETANGENNYSLNKIENYKKNIDSVNEVIEKYSELIIEYFNFIYENIKIKNTTIQNFIVIRGLDTISHVFSYILYYTKNINLTYFHCQKSFYFYVEFVGQISDDEKSFLQLTSRDATTYVYKKTIFEINKEIKTPNEDSYNVSESNDKIEIIDIFINMYKTMMYKVIKYDTINKEDNINNLIEIYQILNKTKVQKENIILLNEICDKLYFIINNDIEKYFETIKKVVKKIKNNEFLNKYKKNIHCYEDLSLL